MTEEVKLPEAAGNKNATPKKRKKIASLDKKKARAGWFFVMPFVLGFVLIYIPIIYNSIVFSFSRLNTDLEFYFVGWLNYRDALFAETGFVETLISGLKQLAFDVPAILIFSLFMAVLLNQKMAGRAAFRAILFIPVILSTGVMASIEASNVLTDYMDSAEGINNGSGGGGATQIVSALDIEVLFANMKVGVELVQMVTSLINNIYDIVNRAGVQILIFLAGLQSISPAIYESCSIDGATAWETFWKITFPMVSPMILVNAVYTVIDSFTAQSNTVMRYIENEYSKEAGVISTAMSWMYFMIVILIIVVVALICRAFVFYQRRD